ncbi:MAG: serine/threonine-protein kinase [Polyangiales bacterium]
MAELLGGKYEVLELAGEGGMAKVYRGRTHGAAGFSRPVAIKRVLAPLSQNPDFLKMFVEEARVVSELDHPNIAQIHDFDRDRAGEYYLVLEWVDGLTLFDWAKAHTDRGLDAPWALVAAVGIEVLKALHAAHQHTDPLGAPTPIVHRDVTPQNVMLSACGVVKLTDFGLARAMDRSSITKPGFVKGKIAYLAPELTYEARPNAQTDVFSTAVVLWEALAGEKMFKGKDPVKVIRTIQGMNIPSLAGTRPDIPPRLCAIVDRALERDPRARYPTAREMGRDLAGLLREFTTETDEHALSQSVAWAREQLGEEPVTRSFPAQHALALATSADETIPDASIPLTRRIKRT